jgi:acetolactate synthase-1/2/3 large subunit
MDITGSDLLVQSLKAEGVDTLFGIAGDHILHSLDVMADHDFRMIDFRHESGAVHAADAYSRILRKGAVTLSTTPGHANTIPALANALHSEAPIVNISGSADSNNLGRGAMQEFDQIGVAASVTKGAWAIPSPERIPEYVSLAFRTALSGRQGPVHLTIPHDFQSAKVSGSELQRFLPNDYGIPKRVMGDFNQVNRAIELLNSAERPLIFAGSTAAATTDPKCLTEFIKKTHIPFFSEDSARALIPDSQKYSFGIGYQPLNQAAQKLKEADVVMLLGKKLDYTLGFGGSPPFSSTAKIIVVDPSPEQLIRARTANVAILGDIGPVLIQLLEAADKNTWCERKSWLETLHETKLHWDAELNKFAEPKDPIHPMFVSQSLQKFIDADSHVTFDGGDYCHFLRASIFPEKPFRFNNVSSFGMIGVGIPYAIGAQIALPENKVIAVTGDGSFGFNGMEIDTMVRHRLPIKIILGNNSIWGIDWQIQKGLYGRPVWTDLLPTRYDQIAKGLGAYAEHVDNASELIPALGRVFSHDGPALVNINIDQVISPVAEAAITRKLGSHG